MGGPTVFFTPMARFSDLIPAAAAIYGYLLARFGMRGLLDLTRPWRLLLLLLALVAGLLSGFRSFVVLAGLTFAILFCLEGLHRTRYLPALLGVMLLGSVVVLPQAEKLPLMVQRSLSFLPGKFDWHGAGKRHGDGRNGAWECGKTCCRRCPGTCSAAKAGASMRAIFTRRWKWAEAADPLAAPYLVGDYHNGPLSVLIPFGLYGAIAFVWFLAAGLRVLHRNWKFGNPALRSVNALLLAAFAARMVLFLLLLRRSCTRIWRSLRACWA